LNVSFDGQKFWYTVLGFPIALRLATASFAGDAYVVGIFPSIRLTGQGSQS
jgi:hypothetical protein